MSAERTQPAVAGETTITGKNQVSLPAQAVRTLGWTRGDRLVVEVLGENMVVLMKRPQSWTDELAGKLTGVFGTHEQTLRYLEQERLSWEPD
jgi:AbrB family looped-hinge helix DNA binding protein